MDETRVSVTPPAAPSAGVSNTPAEAVSVTVRSSPSASANSTEERSISSLVSSVKVAVEGRPLIVGIILSTKVTKFDAVPLIVKFSGSALFEPAESVIDVMPVLTPPPTPWSSEYQVYSPASEPVSVASLLARTSAAERVSDQNRTSLI